MFIMYKKVSTRIEKRKSGKGKEKKGKSGAEKSTCASYII